MRLIFISPHFDDAILSTGGFIHDQARMGTRVEVWTLSGGAPPEPDSSPFAQTLHLQWGFASAEETVRARRVEDQQAAHIVGAHPVHFNFLDCIYRRDANGAWLYPDSVFVPPHAEDAALPAQMASALAARLQPDDMLYCPLAIGGHVDHVLAWQAVQALARPLIYFADIPYLLDHPEALNPLTKGKPLQVRQVSGQGRSAWVRAIASYRSQLSGLFENPEKMSELIKQYAQPGLRLWEFA